MKKINMKYSSKEVNFNRPLFFETNKFRYFAGKESENIYIYDKADSASVHSRGLVLSMITEISLGFNKAYLVVVDDEFTKLPDSVKDFFLYHEFGHYANGHLNDVKTSTNSALLVFKRAIGILPKMEIEADAYAASVVGTDAAINSLLYLVKNSNASLLSKIEILRRVFHIKRNKHH